MRYTLLIIITILFTSCGDDNNYPKASTDFNTQNYISQTDANEQIVIKDLRQKLLHVNSDIGCKAIHVKEDEALLYVEEFCQKLNFFGFDDWRVPTLKETEEFSKGMDADDLVPYFTFPECKRITGIKEDGTLGAINTHNAYPNFKEVKFKTPAGVRCVREDLTQE